MFDTKWYCPSLQAEPKQEFNCIYSTSSQGQHVSSIYGAVQLALANGSKGERGIEEGPCQRSLVATTPNVFIAVPLQETPGWSLRLVIGSVYEFI